MNIADALTIPLGLPAYLVLDQLRRGASPASILGGEDSLLAEYRNARGYAYRLGQHHRSAHRCLARLALRPGGALAKSPKRCVERRNTAPPSSLRPLQPELARTLANRLPAELMLVGLHPQSRRHPHVLFSLVLLDADRERATRQWIAAVFLPGVLPEVLERARVQLIRACRTDAASE